MTYVITESCIGVKDQACMEVCPEFCIFSEDEDVMSFIDPASCTDCGVCREACSMGAIFPEGAVPRASVEFIAINAAWFGKTTTVRKRVRELGAAMGAPIGPLPARRS